MSDPRWTAETFDLVEAPIERAILDYGGTENGVAVAAADALAALADAGLLVEPGSETRTWSLPPEPGPEVTAVRDADGRVWKIDLRPVSPWWRHGLAGHHFVDLLRYCGPLTDATAEAINGAQT